MEDGTLKATWQEDEPYLLFPQELVGWLADQNLKGAQYSVLFVLFSKLNFDVYMRVSRQEIADKLNIQPVNVSRAMKALKGKKIILEGPTDGKFKTYRLNLYAHLGKTPDEVDDD